ncbi:MAG: Uma2 family endonuclease [Acidobacteria bacterium]|nr:Uma2 family endonuclease [Acidobacteriota bacterium]MCG3193483.1 hypothetical protein [Thermoanaerobaculia bacterium]
MSSVPKPTKMTPEEFLLWERRQESRHEFYDGEIVAMTGASLSHNRLSRNLVRLLGNQLAGSSCEVLGADMRVWIPAWESYVYPDVLVVCGAPGLLDSERDVLLNPRLVIEILSPSTERLDRNKKFRAYQTVESLTEYVLVSQDEQLIEVFTRDGKAWRYVAWLPEAGQVALASVPAALAFADVYEAVELPEAGTA